MTVPTGIEVVDRELARRGPFPDAETAERIAAEILSVWRALQAAAGERDSAVAHGRTWRQS